MDGLLFGSIGVLAEISDRQRHAFNAAFAEADLPLMWEPGPYARMLSPDGGTDRIREQAAAAGIELSDDQIAALHLRRSEIFDRGLLDMPIAPRPGVVRLLDEARAAGIRTAFVTTTPRVDVDTMLAALAARITPDMFDLIVTRDMVEAGKPDPEAYMLAVERLDLTRPVAIEDSAPGLRAALAANIPTVATPGEYSGAQDFTGAALVVPSLDRAQDTPQGRVTVDWLASLA